MDDLICVDILDRPIGSASKKVCHEKGLLHRAFSVFIYDGTRMLIQRRAQGKYHSGGLWTNACCSHPRMDETLDEAVPRRLREELGITCDVQQMGTFVYYHQFGDALFEYEYDHVFAGAYRGELTPDPDEIMACQWVEMEELAHSICLEPEKYTVWFLTAAPLVLKQLLGDSIG